MADCCDPISYRRMFDDKAALRRFRAYRRKGLDPMASGLAQFLRGQVEDKTILEVGGGIGAFQVELLETGARSGVNVELSDGYDEVAARLMDEKGLTGKVQRRLGDFVEIQHDLDPADIVILNRVICCYPWMDRLMTAATSRTRGLLALVFPRDYWLTRVLFHIDNGFSRLRRCDFRAYVHPVDDIEAIAVDAGMTRVYARQGLIWRSVVFQR